MEQLSLLKGRYELKEALGHGGMGVVYRAYDRVLKCDVVVKTIRDAPEPAALELFQRECEALVALNHPNIVQILDIGQFEEEGQTKPYFVMPLLPGRTLDKLIRDATVQLTVQRCSEIVSQVCRGLHAAHERGLIHRDIKPANVFVMPDLSAELIDFGVAHVVSMGNTGQKGTLFYMAPELLQGREPSTQSDIFALGVTAYELFTRRRPFERPTEREVIEAILHEIPPPASDFNASINQAVSRVLNKAMAKQPWHRFSTAREFAECLEKAARGEIIECFDPARIRPRIDRAKTAFGQGDHQFALEILTELEAEGHLDPDLVLLRTQIDVAMRQKRIQQLLDGGRTRLESEEYPLALQKIQEVLALDPGNVEALTLKAKVESTRSERQIDGWFRLARQHLENNAFAHAREALENVLKVRSQSTRASNLLAEVDRREREYLQIRQQKEQLFSAAVEAHQKGEVSSAMSLLEQVIELDRRAPDTSQPERGASYQSFYNQVRSDHDAIKNSYAEARRRLDEQKFSEAIALCDACLRKYPGQALFQALKFDIEEQQRLQSSGYVAEIDRRVEAEPDLEQKVEILEQALDRFPEEPHFQRSHRLMRERLELVKAIVAKARHYEENSQFTEALGQWEILRTIHGRYPGLAFEIERVTKRREQQAKAEARARWVEDIDRQLQTGDYARAASLCRSALEEFEGDSELKELEKLAAQSEERCNQARQLHAQAEQRFEAGLFEEGLDLTRRAHGLDPRNAAIRAAFLDRLTEGARALMTCDWRRAGTLLQEALNLDGGHPEAKSLQMLLEDAKREEFMNHVVGRARQSQASGDFADAIAQVSQALARFPGDARLLQLHATLTAAQQEGERAKAPPREPEAALAPPRGPAPQPPPAVAPPEPIVLPPEPPASPLPAQAAPQPEHPSMLRKAEPARKAPRRAASHRAIWAVVLVLVVAVSVTAWLVTPRRRVVSPATPPEPAGPAAAAVVPEVAPETNPPANAAAGSLRVEVIPSIATLTYRRADEKAARPFQLPAMDLQPGRYVVTAAAPGYATASRTVVIAEASTASLRLELTSLEPEVRVMDVKDWDKPWTQQGEWFIRQGGGFALYSHIPSNGTYQFAAKPQGSWVPFTSPKVRWVAGYLDPGNYILFEMDRNTYTCTDIAGGKPRIRVAKRPHHVKADSYALRLYVESGRLVVMLMGDDREYKMLDDWNQSGREFGAGSVGFYTPGSDQVWLTNFIFSPGPVSKR